MLVMLLHMAHHRNGSPGMIIVMGVFQ